MNVHHLALGALVVALALGADAWSAARDETIRLVTGRPEPVWGLGEADPVAPPGVTLVIDARGRDAWLGRPSWHATATAAPGASSGVLVVGDVGVPVEVFADTRAARAADPSICVRWTGTPPGAWCVAALLAAAGLGALGARTERRKAVELAALGVAEVLVARGESGVTELVFADLPVAVGDALLVHRSDGVLAGEATVTASRDGTSIARFLGLLSGARHTVRQASVDRS